MIRFFSVTWSRCHYRGCEQYSISSKTHPPTRTVPLAWKYNSCPIPASTSIMNVVIIPCLWGDVFMIRCTAHRTLVQANEGIATANCSPLNAHCPTINFSSVSTSGSSWLYKPLIFCKEVQWSQAKYSPLAEGLCSVAEWVIAAAELFLWKLHHSGTLLSYKEKDSLDREIGI